MPRPKDGELQAIFDDYENAGDTGSYGYLSFMFEIFATLAYIRQSQGLTQHALVDKTGIAQSTIAKIESGRLNPSLYQLVMIAYALGAKIGFKRMSEHEIGALKDIDMESFLE